MESSAGQYHHPQPKQKRQWGQQGEFRISHFSNPAPGRYIELARA
jgi:hypothetical protein